MPEKTEPSFHELKRRLAAAESALQAIRDGQADAIIGTDRKLVVRLAEAEARERHIKRVLLASRNVYQLIAKEEDPHRLIERACENLTGTLGYFNAWIALVDPFEGAVTMTAASGFNGGFDAMRIQLERGNFPDCMQRTLEREELTLVHDPATECPDCPLAHEYRGRAGMTRRLSCSNRIWGVLSVSVLSNYAADEEQQKLFTEMADDLAFALNKIEVERQFHLLKYIIETTPHPMSFVSKDYRYLAVNEAYSKFYDAAPDDILGHEIADFCGRDVFETEIKPSLGRCLKGEHISYEVYIDFPGTGYRWMEMEYNPYRDASGNVAGVVSHGHDITERKQIENTLRENLEQQDAIFESSMVGIMVLHDRIITKVNRRMADMLGYTPEELVGEGPEKVHLSHEHFVDFGETYYWHLAERTIVQVEYPLRHKDGHTVWCLFSGKAIAPPDMGRGAVWIIDDITARKQAEEALRESEERLSVLFEQATDAIYVCNLKGELTQVNRQACQATGYTEEELLCMNVDDVDAEYASSKLSNVLDALEPGRPVTIESQHKRKDGVIYPVEITVGLLKLPDEDFVLGIARDISERKQAENAIRASEEKARSILNASRAAIVMLDRRGTILDCNDVHAARFAIKREEMLGSCVWDFLPKKIAELRKERIASVFETGKPFWGEDERQGIWNEYYIKPAFHNEKGEVQAVVVEALDITSRKQAETALRESELQKELILNSTAEMVVYYDTDLRIIWANNASGRSVDRTDAELAGRHCYEIWHHKDEPCKDCPVLKAKETRKPQSAEMQTPEGRYWSIRGYPVLNDDGEVISLVEFGQEITGRKQAEAEKLQLEEQLRQSQKMEAVGTLAGGIAHDFNNILQGIIGYGELAKLDITPEQPGYEEITNILQGAERAATLTRQLLAFSRRQLIRPVNLDLNDVVDGLSKMLHRLIGEHIDLNLRLCYNIMPVHADAGALEQILMNLCVNARDAMPDGGQLTLETESVVLSNSFCKTHPWSTPGAYTLLSVTDTGAGMPPDVVKQIFEPFFTTKGVGKGTGLGLSMVYGLVKQHEGLIHCSSKPGKGTCFKIYLPCIDETVEKAAKEIDDSTTVMGVETILFAEDDPMVRDAAVRTLKKKRLQSHTSAEWRGSNPALHQE